MINPKVALDALRLKSYLKKNKIEPLKVFESSSFNEKNQLWVYTFQCGFKTEKELDNFKLFTKILNIGILESTS